MKRLHESCMPSSTFVARLKHRDELHEAALQRRQDELDRVKRELEQAKEEKAAAESALQEKTRLLTEMEDRAQLAETRLEELRVKPAQWLVELRFLNQEMSGNPLARFLSLYLQLSESTDSD